MHLGSLTAKAAALLTLTAVSASAQYTFVDLNPGAPVLYSYARGVDGEQQVGYGPGIGGYDALLWNGSPDAVVSLKPDGFTSTIARAASGSQQVGSGAGAPTGNMTHALLWSGTAKSWVDLHPEVFSTSYATGVFDGRQVGVGTIGGVSHALLWTSTAASAVDLNPAFCTSSQALGVWGISQAGTGVVGGQQHALLWFGTAASAVDLNPGGTFTVSGANGTWDGQQVGFGTGAALSGANHALLWSGTAGSYIDLHPLGFSTSVAHGVSNGAQVGYGETGGVYHALVWAGSAASCVDLHAFVGPGYVASSAYGIDAAGNIVGYAKAADGNFHAVLWKRNPSVVPEAGSLALLLTGVAPLGLALRRRPSYLLA